MNVSLVLSTYNWPNALKLVFDSILQQSIFPNEIIIADDGSSLETKEIIDKYLALDIIPIYHVWQEDNGFRKSSVLNKAIISAKSPFIIQIDGDCILHKHFVKDHLKFIKPNTFVHGSRVLLNNSLTNEVLNGQKLMILLNFYKISNLFNSIYIPFLSTLLAITTKSLKGTRGCNFAFYKRDFINVNGYNEDIVGWGREDTELSIRLMNNGIKQRRLKLSGIVYHLNHLTVSRSELQNNIEILKKSLDKSVILCENGCSKYL